MAVRLRAPTGKGGGPGCSEPISSGGPICPHPARGRLLAGESGGRVRWIICGLLFFATTVNYIDRQVLGILKPTLVGELHWSESDYGWIVFSFQCAYALMMP